MIDTSKPNLERILSCLGDFQGFPIITEAMLAIITLSQERDRKCTENIIREEVPLKSEDSGIALMTGDATTTI